MKLDAKRDKAQKDHIACQRERAKAERAVLTHGHIADQCAKAMADGRRRELPDHGHASMKGLYGVCNPSGTFMWTARITPPEGGNPRRYPLGKWPKMGLAAARVAAQALRDQIIRGEDPRAKKRAMRKTADDLRQGIGTLDHLITLYETSTNPGPPASWAKARPTVRRVFADLLPKPIATMDAGDVRACAGDYSATPSAKFALRSLHPVIVWAVERKKAPRELMDFSAGAITRRERILIGDELGRVLIVLHAMNRSHSRAMLMMLWTITRLEEVCAARWSEINLDVGTWTLPPPYVDPISGKLVKRTKNGKEHIIRLPRQALDMLRSVNPRGDAVGWVFPARARGGTSRPVGNWDKFQKIVFKGSRTVGWNRQDLRRSGATMMAATGTPPHIIEAGLNHVSIGNPLAATYNRHRYGSEVGSALQSLADWLDYIAGRTKREPGRSHGSLNDAPNASSARLSA
jgi:integrase